MRRATTALLRGPLTAGLARFTAGHRLAVVLAGGDLAYRGSTTPQAVHLTTGGSTDRLAVPLAQLPAGRCR